MWRRSEPRGIANRPFRDNGSSFWVKGVGPCEKLDRGPTADVSHAGLGGMEVLQLNPVFMEYRYSGAAYMRGWFLLAAVIATCVGTLVLKKHVSFSDPFPLMVTMSAAAGSTYLLAWVILTKVLMPAFRSPPLYRLSRRTGRIVEAKGLWTHSAEFLKLIPVRVLSGKTNDILLLLDIDETAEVVRRAYPVSIVVGQPMAQASYELLRRYMLGDLKVGELPPFSPVPPTRYGWIHTARNFFPVRVSYWWGNKLGRFGALLHVVVWGVLTGPSWLLITLADAWLPVSNWKGYEKDFAYDIQRDGAYPSTLVQYHPNSFLQTPTRAWEVPAYLLLMLVGTVLWGWGFWVWLRPAA